jgi:uncharacterized phage protein (TIGR02220 family)
MFENISASYDVGVAKKYGINSAVLLNKLIYLSRYTSRNDGYCWKTSKELEDELGLSRYQQDIAIKKLTEENLIETKNTYIIGTQIKCKHFKLLLDISKCDLRETNKSIDLRETDISDLRETNKSVNNNKTIIINNNIKEIINYLNTKLDTNYKYTTKQTQSMINARLKEGFTVDDFKKVIDKKYNEWLNTEFEQYLTPQTLFSTKFEKYLNQKTKQEVNPYEGVRVL